MRVKNNILSENVPARIMLHDDIGIDTFACDTMTFYTYTCRYNRKPHKSSYDRCCNWYGCRGPRRRRESADSQRRVIASTGIALWANGYGLWIPKIFKFFTKISDSILMYVLLHFNSDKNIFHINYKLQWCVYIYIYIINYKWMEQISYLSPQQKS